MFNEDTASLKIELLPSDAEVFQNYCGIMVGREKGKYGNRRFAMRYKFICDIFKEEFEDLESLIAFFNKVNDVKVLQISAENMSDAFTVFSSINAKGLPLTLIDLMKSTYLGEATKANVSLDVAYQNWQELVEIFTDDNGDQNSNVITQFLLNNYDTFEGSTSSSITKNSALKKYEDIFSSNNGEKYIDTLIYNAKIFSMISPHVTPKLRGVLSEDISGSLEKLMKLDSSQSYPLLLKVLCIHINNQKDLSEENIIDICQNLINFYIRRNIAQKPKSSNVRSKMLEMVRKINNDPSQASMIIYSGLSDISVSDAEFELSLKEGVYDISPETVRYVLIDLERTYGKEYFNKQNPDNLDDYIVSKRGQSKPIWTIEHILPVAESLKNGWREMIYPDNIDQADYYHKKNMHKFGNLTLTGLNSELSNKSFQDKRDYKSNESNSNYSGLQTPLFLNSSIANTEIGENIETKKAWTVADIERRTNALSLLILDRYKL